VGRTVVRSFEELRECRSPESARRNERIRVAFCVDNMQVGGTELNAVRTAERLDRCRFDLSVVCLQSDGPLMRRYSDVDIPVHIFPIRSLYGRHTFRQGLRLARYLRDNRIAVFHAHDLYSNIFGAPWARFAGTPAVLTSRRWWVQTPRWGHRLANRFSYRFADRVIANAPRVASLLESEGVRSSRVTVVPNFVDDDAFESFDPAEQRRRRAALGLPQRVCLIGMVANLTPVKDHTSLLRAMATLAPSWPAVNVVFAGEGPLRQHLQELAAEIGIGNRVHFLGLQPNRPNLHALFDVSVLCSRSEALSNSLIEAMAAARPLVATDVGANRDALTDGVTGILVPVSDPRRLAEAIDDLLRHEVRRREMGEAAQRRAREMFSASRAIGTLEDLYEELTGK
jgi:glycosyltransferase involved in cell wall biosynthesis